MARWPFLSDVLYVTNPREYAVKSLEHRGFLPRDHVVNGLEIAYLDDDFERVGIPAYNASAIRNMATECHSRDKRFVLFKVPVSNWTKGHSASVQEFADECGIEFLTSTLIGTRLAWMPIRICTTRST